MDRTRLASGEMTGQHSNQLNYRSSSRFLGEAKI
jgi:hypothetical protein